MKTVSPLDKGGLQGGFGVGCPIGLPKPSTTTPEGFTTAVVSPSFPLGKGESFQRSFSCRLERRHVRRKWRPPLDKWGLQGVLGVGCRVSLPKPSTTTP